MTRELALQKELAQIKALNSTVDHLLKATSKTHQDIIISKETTDNTAALLGDWVRILNQTKFVHGSLRNPEWTGVEEAEVSDEIEVLSREEAQLEAELLTLEAENERLERSGIEVSSPERSVKRVRI